MLSHTTNEVLLYCPMPVVIMFRFYHLLRFPFNCVKQGVFINGLPRHYHTNGDGTVAQDFDMRAALRCCHDGNDGNFETK